MARCGCSGSVACSCILQEGDNVTVTGNGSVGSPYVISANDNLITVNDTPTVDLTLVPGSPDILTAAVKLDPAGGNLITATANGLRLDCATISAVCGIVAVTVLDSTSIDFTISAGQITGGVIIDPVGGNLLTNPGTGLRVVCSSVRGCFSAGNGITYNAGTGAISAKISTDLNNRVVFGSDNGLFVPAGAATGQAVQNVYTASTTWNRPAPSAGLKGIWVELQGGGGGSGGCATTAASQTSSSGGGKGGAYARFWLDITLLSASHPVVVGTGGIAAVAGANNGGNGVASSFDAFGSVPGGEGGAGGGAAAISGASTTQSGGSAAQVFTGTATGVLFVQGDDGGTGVRLSLAQAAIPGYGGACHLGRQARLGNISGGAMPAVAGSLYGGGAAGPANMVAAGQTQQAGAAGASGIVIVTEVY